ncbi:MAG TPA: hypothetical protein VM597_15460 [Gemmataceae bacterium]|jgi:hypothetical protein|nr:hypothetical protein [Gemmataceae bacterium]
MMFVIFWLALAFAAAVTTVALVFLVLGHVQARQRRLFLSLGTGSLILAWVPTVALYAVLFASGARPAGWGMQSNAAAPTPAAKVE